MNIFKQYFYILVISIIFILLNCTQNSISDNGNNVNDKKFGNININIINKNNNRTIYPVYKSVENYVITGNGPDSETLSIDNITDSSKYISSLLCGNWDITVNGKDISNDIIVRGAKNITVIENNTIDLTIDVYYLQESTGEVDITINWPLTITVTGVELKINSDLTEDLTLSGTSVRYHNSNFVSGFHKMFFKFKNNNNEIATVIESVHIYDNLITSTEINLIADEFKKPPFSPSGLTANEGVGKIVLNWTDNSNVETGFVVERSETSGSGFVAVGETDLTPLNANTITYDDTTAAAGVSYYYRVKAINSFGSSEYSEEVSSVLSFPEILNIYPLNNSTGIELSSDIKIVFNQNMNNLIRGSINFNNPAITFKDTINCLFSSFTTNVTDDTVIINPFDDLLEDTLYSNITIIGFVDTTGNYMLPYNDSTFNFKTADLTAPTIPIISIDPLSPTNENVTVTIDYSTDSVIKQYKIGTGTYTDYTNSFIVSDNCIIYAKSKDAANNWSNEGSLTISNIDKTGPTASVSYSTTSSTNGNVTATITPSEPVTITNNGGSNSYTFTTNGSFTFNFVDASGNTGSVTATVNNIDKTGPTATVSYSTTDPTNGNVTATITPSESVTITNNGGSATYTFTANGSFTFNFTDTAGNTGSITATVNNIDKSSPTATVSYSTASPTNGNVTATITPSESVTITNNSGLDNYTFTANGSFTFNFTDAAGNT